MQSGRCFAATAVLGVGSVVTTLAGVATAKINALELGPSGLGLFALLQATLGIAGIVTVFGMSASLVRSGAVALVEREPGLLARLWTACWLLFWCFSIPAALIVWLFRAPISSALVAGPGNSAAVGWVAPALIFSTASAINTALINAHHRVSVLARTTVYSAVAQMATTISVVVAFGRPGIPFAILGASVLGWAVSHTMRKRHIAEVGLSSISGATSAARGLLVFGGPYTLSMLLGAGSMLLLPVIVVALFDESHVGYVRAASTLGVTYVGFLLAAMGQDYFPRLSSVSNNAGRVNAMVNSQLDVILLVGVPLIFGLMTVAPIAVPVLYSRSFTPAIDILEWQLVGDIFKLASWALTFTMVARGRAASYLAVEAVGGVLLLGVTFGALRLLGITGYGVGYAVTYVAYCGVAYLVVRRQTRFRFTNGNFRKIMMFGVAVVLTKVVLDVSDNSWAYLLPGALAVFTGVGSARRGVISWRKVG